MKTFQNVQFGKCSSLERMQSVKFNAKLSRFIIGGPGSVPSFSLGFDHWEKRLRGNTKYLRDQGTLLVVWVPSSLYFNFHRTGCLTWVIKVSMVKIHAFSVFPCS